MNSAEDGPSSDVTEPLDGTKQRRILGQSKMWPDMVVVGSIGLEDPAQVALAQDHDVIPVDPSLAPEAEYLCLLAWKKPSLAESAASCGLQQRPDATQSRLCQSRAEPWKYRARAIFAMP
jgi:hypothetical protein